MNRLDVKGLIAEKVARQKFGMNGVMCIENPKKKTEELLFHMSDIMDSDAESVKNIRLCLSKMMDDPYFEIIDMKYFQKMTHEEIAERMNIDPRTVTRRKNSLIDRLSFMLFTDSAILDLLKRNE